MARVWALSKQSGTGLLMLLAIADFADDDGNAYPSVGTLAAKCRMSDRNANHILAALQAAGELEVRHNEGPRGTNRYRVALPDGDAPRRTDVRKAAPLKPASPLTPEARFTPPEEPFTLKPVAGRGEARSRTPLKPASDEPSLNRQEPPRGAPKRAARFDAGAIDLPDWLPRSAWMAWAADRQERGKPITSRAALRQIATLRALREEGHEPANIINRAIERGWQGLFAPHAAGAGQRRPAALRLDAEEQIR